MNIPNDVSLPTQSLSAFSSLSTEPSTMKQYIKFRTQAVKPLPQDQCPRAQVHAFDTEQAHPTNWSFKPFKPLTIDSVLNNLAFGIPLTLKDYKQGERLIHLYDQLLKSSQGMESPIRAKDIVFKRIKYLLTEINGIDSTFKYNERHLKAYKYLGQLKTQNFISDTLDTPKVETTSISETLGLEASIGTQNLVTHTTKVLTTAIPDSLSNIQEKTSIANSFLPKFLPIIYSISDCALKCGDVLSVISAYQSYQTAKADGQFIRTATQAKKSIQIQNSKGLKACIDALLSQRDIISDYMSTTQNSFSILSSVQSILTNPVILLAISAMSSTASLAITAAGTLVFGPVILAFEQITSGACIGYSAYKFFTKRYKDKQLANWEAALKGEHNDKYTQAERTVSNRIHSYVEKWKSSKRGPLPEELFQDTVIESAIQDEIHFQCIARDPKRALQILYEKLLDEQIVYTNNSDLQAKLDMSRPATHLLQQLQIPESVIAAIIDCIDPAISIELMRYLLNIPLA